MDDLLKGRVRFRHRDVFSYGSAEQKVLLQDDANISSQVCKIIFPDVHAIKTDQATLHFKEYNKGKLAYLDAKNEKQIEYITSEEGNYFEYFDGVYNTIRNRAQPHISGWDGYRTMVVMEAVYKSAATGTKVTIDYEGIEN